MARYLMLNMNWDQLRYLEGERLGWTGKEAVALGGLSRVDGRMNWYPMANVLDGLDGEHNFAVDGYAVRDIMFQARRDAVSLAILWHSHRELERPSVADINGFPHWLMMGVVWCTTSGSLSTYDMNGFISCTKGNGDRVTSAIAQAEQELIKAGVRPQDAHAVAIHVIDQYGLN